jgi:phosphoglucosamine mutase
LAELLEGVSLFPQTLINVRMRPDADWKSNGDIDEAINAARKALGNEGRVLIRASGTEPVLRVMVEAHDADAASQYAESIANTVRAVTA